MSGDIVVVDDEPGTLRLLKTLLENDGHEVRAFTGGAAALRSIGVTIPTLIMLDIRMPGLSGFDICETLKADPATARLPVFFLSAASEVDDKIKAFEAGGIDYITKPFDKAEVLARVRTHVALAKSQQEVGRYKQLIETSNIGTVMSHVDGSIAVVNDAVCELSGFDRDAALQMTWMQVLPEPDLGILLGVVEDLLARRSDNYRAEHTFIHADGNPRWIDLSISCIRAPDGQPEYLIFQAIDITADVHLREHLAETQRLLEASADSMLDPQVLLEADRNSDGHVLDFHYRAANRAAFLYLQLEKADLLGSSAIEKSPGLKTSGLLAHYIRCLEDGQPVILSDFSYDNEIIDATRRYDIRATRAGPNLLSMTWTDVTDRFEAAARLAASEEKYRLIAENSGDVVAHIRDGRFVWVSPSVKDVLGAPPEYWIGRAVSELLPPGNLPAHAARWTKLGEDNVIQERMQVRAFDGSMHWIHLRATPFYDADGRQDGVSSAFRLIDSEVAAEKAVADANRQQARADALYRRSMDSSAVGMCLIDPGGGFVDVNDAVCEFFGYDAETLKRKTWQELTAEPYLQADLDQVAAVLAGRIDSYRMTKQYIHADGRHIWGDLAVGCVRDDDGHVEFFISQINDITDDVRAREELAASEERNRVLAQGLEAELDSAATYMASIMPTGLQGSVAVSSRYLPSRQLGGDCIDYYWVDDDHLLVRLIDVSGHGVEPALLAVSIHNLMRSGSLTPEILLSPEAVLTELNRLFEMKQHNDHYFTMWYGVYERSTRTLRYASAGAPPALAFNTTTGTVVTSTKLTTPSPPIGLFEDTEFTSRTFQVPPGCRILIHTDGASEIELADGRQLTLAGFERRASRLAASSDWSLDDLVDELRALTQSGHFEDDCSLIQVKFD